MEFIAIDIGTSFTKGAIVDVESMKIRDVFRNSATTPLTSENPLFHELNPAHVVDGVKNVITNLSRANNTYRGILLCGQMGGLVLCNNRGQALRPYISWLDRRATECMPQSDESYLDSLNAIVGDRARSLLGNEFRAGLPFSFLSYLNRTGELKMYDGASPVTLPDFVAAALCETEPVMEWTNATGLLDVSRKCFPENLITELNLSHLNWPQIVDFRHHVGEYRDGGKSLPVYAATGDHQCSLAGTLLADDELSINISTGSQVSMLSPTAEVGDFQIRPYFDGQLLKTITNIPAGRALTAIIRLLSESSPAPSGSADAWNYFFQQAERTAVSNINVNLAFFPGAVKGPGMLSNLSEDNLTVGHIARASLQQMACYYEQFGYRISPDADWSRLAFSGGIAQKSPLLRKLIAERLSADFRTASTSEDSLLGMMVLGRVIAGLDATVAKSSAFVANNMTDG